MRIRILSELKDEEVLRRIADALREIYGEEVELELAENLIDERFLNPLRRQYDAWRIVQYYQHIPEADEYLSLIHI